jgi:hypothetical protein
VPEALLLSLQQSTTSFSLTPCTLIAAFYSPSPSSTTLEAYYFLYDHVPHSKAITASHHRPLSIGDLQPHVTSRLTRISSHWTSSQSHQILHSPSNLQHLNPLASPQMGTPSIIHSTVVSQQRRKHRSECCMPPAFGISLFATSSELSHSEYPLLVNLVYIGGSNR